MSDARQLETAIRFLELMNNIRDTYERDEYFVASQLRLWQFLDKYDMTPINDPHGCEKIYNRFIVLLDEYREYRKWPGWIPAIYGLCENTANEIVILFRNE